MSRGVARLGVMLVALLVPVRLLAAEDRASQRAAAQSTIERTLSPEDAWHSTNRSVNGYASPPQQVRSLGVESTAKSEPAGARETSTLSADSETRAVETPAAESAGVSSPPPHPDDAGASAQSALSDLSRSVEPAQGEAQTPAASPSPAPVDAASVQPAAADPHAEPAKDVQDTAKEPDAASLEPAPGSREASPPSNEAPVDGGHGADPVSADHTAPAEAARGDPAASHEAAAAPTDHATSAQDVPGAEPKAEGGGWFSSILNAVGLGGGEGKVAAKSIEGEAAKSAGDGPVSAPSAHLEGLDPASGTHGETGAPHDGSVAADDASHAADTVRPSAPHSAIDPAPGEAAASAAHDVEPGKVGSPEPHGELHQDVRDAPNTVEAPEAEGGNKPSDQHAAEAAQTVVDPSSVATETADGGSSSTEAALAGQEHAAPDANPEGGGWVSSLLSTIGLGDGGTSSPPAEGGKDGEHLAPDGHASPEREAPSAEHGQPPAPPATAGAASHAEASPEGGDGHGGDKPADPHAAESGGEHAATKSEGGGLFSSLLGMVGLGGGSKPADGHAAKPADGHGAEVGQAEPAAHGEEAGNGEGDGHGGEAAHGDEKPPPPPMWPASPAVADDRQPYVLIRTLRTVQDQVARGNIDAFKTQKLLLRDLSEQMRSLPPEVWDDTRNVRAAVYYVLTGGDPRVLTVVAGHKTPIYVPRRVIKGALAFGEGRQNEASSSFETIVPRTLDSSIAGIVALIKGTLAARKDSKAAIALFDEARLLSPGTLIEESALRQELLLLARDGELKRFDLLATQYWRRFPGSLFARTFRRQFFAGVAHQDFKGGSAWIPRAETEIARMPEGDRPGLYLSIAQEAIKGGHIDVVNFAAENAAKVYRSGSLEMQRANLYRAAALVATDQAQAGIELLGTLVRDRFSPQDREIYDAAAGVGAEVLRAPSLTQDLSEAQPASVSRAKEVLSSVDALFEGEAQ